MSSNVWEARGVKNTIESSKEQHEFMRFQAFRQAFVACTQPTRLVRCSLELATRLGVEGVDVKDEGNRWGMRSFKILGVSFAVDQLLKSRSDKPVLCTMTDGNHGTALAATAKQRGLKAVVYVPANLSAAREDGIKSFGAEVIRIQGTYDDAIAVVRREASSQGWLLVSDTSWEGYYEIPRMIVAGYGTLFEEVQAAAGETVYTHVLVQAGVGGLAAAAAAWLHQYKGTACWRNDVRLVVVEPKDAACCYENACQGLDADELRECSGKTDSIMAGLNCGIPSLVAWPLIRRTASHYVVIDDSWAEEAMRILAEEGIVAGESGAAGLGGALSGALPLSPGSKLLILNTESDTDPERYAQILSSKTMSSRGALSVSNE